MYITSKKKKKKRKKSSRKKYRINKYEKKKLGVYK